MYKLFSNWVDNKFAHFNLEIFPYDPLPIHCSKTANHVTVEFYFYKKSVLVSNIINKIPETFRF